MTILSAIDVSKTYGYHPLFTKINLIISEGDQIGIIGANGSGKSTLLKILSGMELPDEGTVAKRKNLKIGYVTQGHSLDLKKNIRNFSQENQIQWEKNLDLAGFTDLDRQLKDLSGGWLKRLQIIHTMTEKPDLLMLDEPTNHLDIEGILWLEDWLQRARVPYIVISHDRYFLENVTNRMIELSKQYPGGLLAQAGSYSDFVDFRTTFLENQQQYQASLANKVRRETEWLRRGAKARSTKQAARSNQAIALQQELEDLKVRGQTTTADFKLQDSQKRAKRLISLEKVSLAFGEKKILQNLDLVLASGVRLGLLGLNGSGKTTLLKLINNQLKPDSGTIQYADPLKIIYFDQHRKALIPGMTLQKTLAPLGDFVEFLGQRMHISGFAKKFAFTPQQLNLPIEKLSGGEQARALIAQLFLQSADVLILDEPTNDLDIPTLEALEDSLLEFNGSIILVTHDRYLLDRVSTKLLALEENCKTNFYADFFQWQSAQKIQIKEKNLESKKTDSNAGSKKKLTYAERIEFDQMESKIMIEEEALEKLREELDKVQSDRMRLSEVAAAIETRQTAVENLYKRWVELQEKS